MNFQIFNPNPYLYHFRDPMGTCFSIIKGTKHALVIDTGYGILNVKSFIESYIDTPYTVLCTHGHMDHTAGSYLFDEVYIPELDLDLYYEHNNLARRQLNIKIAKETNNLPVCFNEDAYINATCKNIKTLKVGTTFDLGNLHVETIAMEGHTKGSVGFLIKELKLLLTGDSAILNVWLFLKESTSKDVYLKMLERVKKLDFKTFITGHILREFSKNYFDYFIEVANEANKINAVKTTFKNFERDNTYSYSKKYDNDTIGICFYEE